MDNNVPQGSPPNEYGHYATAGLPPTQTQSSYHPSGPMTSPYPTTTHQQHTMLNDNDTDTAMSTSNTGDADQQSVLRTAPATIDRIGYDEREMK